jgi:glycosyltransferase involved in cell wall biosynthesis
MSEHLSKDLTECPRPGPVSSDSIQAAKDMVPDSGTIVPDHSRPAIASAAISMVLVTENSSQQFNQVFEEYDAYLKSLGREYEIVIVDNASSDGTAPLAARKCSGHAQTRLFRLSADRGFGRALHVGIEAAHYPLLFYTVCDPGYRAADLGRLLEHIDHVDLIAGFRVNNSGRSPISWRDRGYRWLARVLFAVRLKDLRCVFVLARRKMFQRILLQSKTVAAQVEIIAKANFLGYLMTETAVSYTANGRQGKWSGVMSDVRRVFLYPGFGPPFLGAGGIPTEL